MGTQHFNDEEFLVNLSDIESDLKKRRYSVALQESCKVFEQIFKKLVRELELKLNIQERAEMSKIFKSIDPKETYENYTFGKLVRLFHEAKVFDRLKQKENIDFGMISTINFFPIVRYRNTAAHKGEASQGEAELIFTYLMHFLAVCGLLDIDSDNVLSSHSNTGRTNEEIVLEYCEVFEEVLKKVFDEITRLDVIKDLEEHSRLLDIFTGMLEELNKNDLEEFSFAEMVLLDKRSSFFNKWNELKNKKNTESMIHTLDLSYIADIQKKIRNNKPVNQFETDIIKNYLTIFLANLGFENLSKKVLGDERLSDTYLKANSDDLTSLSEESPICVNDTSGEDDIQRQIREEDELAWQEAQRLNTIDSYSEYLNDKTIIMQHEQEALDSIKKLEQMHKQDEEVWSKAVEEDTISGYKKYIVAKTAQFHRSEAQLYISELQTDINEWKTASELDTIDSYSEYLNSGNCRKKHKEEAQQKLNKLMLIDKKNKEDTENKAWSLAQSLNTSEAYEEYIEKLPLGLYVDKAREAINLINCGKIDKQKSYLISNLLYFLINKISSELPAIEDAVQPEWDIESSNKVIDVGQKLMQSNGIVREEHIGIAFRCRANAYLDLENYEQAFDDYNKAVEIHEKLAGSEKAELSQKYLLELSISLNDRGQAFSSLGKHQEAIDDFANSLDIVLKSLRNKTDANILYHLASVHINMGLAYEGLDMPKIALVHYSEAVKTRLELSKWGKLKNHEDLAKAYGKRADLYSFKLNKYYEAIEDYSAAIKYLKANKTYTIEDGVTMQHYYMLHRGAAYYYCEGKEAMALQDYDYIINDLRRMKEDNLQKIYLCDALTYRGNALLYLAKYKEAVSDFDEAIYLKQHVLGVQDKKAKDELDQMHTNRAKALAKLNNANKETAEQSKVTEVNNDKAEKTHVTIGSLAGNIVNDGFVAEMDNWVYIAADDKIYKLSQDNLKASLLINNKAFSRYLNAVGDSVYYNNVYPEKLNAIKKGVSSKLCDCTLSRFITVKGNFIYFTSGKYNNIHKMKTDGSNLIKISADKANCINVAGDWIYYANGSDRNYLYKIRANGTDKKLLCEDKAECINVVGSWVYYIKTAFWTNYIVKVRLDGSGRQELLKETFYRNLCVYNGWIYYTIIDKGIYKLSTNGGTPIRLSEDKLSRFNVTANHIYYISDRKIYRIKLDSTDKTCISDILK